MKKIIAGAVVVCALLFGCFSAGMVSAAEKGSPIEGDICSMEPKPPGCSGHGDGGIISRVPAVINIILFIVAISAIIGIIFGGVRYSTSQGDG